MGWRLATDIAKRIKDLRDALGWSQQRLGDEVGRRYQQIWAWEVGDAKPPRGVLERLAEKHGWPLEIFGEGGRMPSDVVNLPLTGRSIEERGPIEGSPPVGRHLPNTEQDLRPVTQPSPTPLVAVEGGDVLSQAVAKAVERALRNDEAEHTTSGREAVADELFRFAIGLQKKAGVDASEIFEVVLALREGRI